jgi:hypothetical protein
LISFAEVLVSAVPGLLALAPLITSRLTFGSSTLTVFVSPGSTWAGEALTALLVTVSGAFFSQSPAYTEYGLPTNGNRLLCVTVEAALPAVPAMKFGGEPTLLCPT